ncbi:hypothetical protein [Cryobacterium sp. M96]|nr:hypothetical protein [Cryobacterium sp. M96]
MSRTATYFVHNSVVDELYTVSCPDILPTGPPDLKAGKGTPTRIPR